jgi:hypothetical protein
MALSAFEDKAQLPSDEDLKTTLSDSYPIWTDLREQVKASNASIEEEWGFSSSKTGWGFRLRKGKRVILYMTPCHGYFLASFVLGEKAVKAAQEIGLPDWMLEAIEGAPRYAEGRGVRLKVTSAEDSASLLKLAEVKLAY